MFKHSIFSSVLLLFAATLSAEQLVSVGRTNTAPVLDGDLQDACYRNTMPITGLTLPSNMELANNQTVLRMVCDDEYLYGALTAQLGKNQSLSARTPSRNDQSVWQRDSVEIFFCSNSSKIHHYMLDYSGSSCAFIRNYVKVNGRWTSEVYPASKIKVKSKVVGNRWQMEFAIPRQELPQGDIKFNIIRNNGRNSHSSWARLDEINWTKPEKYGTLKLVEQAPSMNFDLLPELKLKSLCTITIDPVKDLQFKFTASGKNILPEISGNKINFAYKALPDSKTVTLQIFAGKNRLYDYTLSIPPGSLSMTPKNLVNNTLLLPSGIKLAGTIMWHSKHNMKSTEAGGRLKIQNSLIFEVPEGVTPEKCTKIAEKIVDGKKISVFKQKQRFAYNAPDWISSSFVTTLPPGSTGTIRYQLKWQDGVQPFSEFKFKVMEIKSAPMPKKFISGFYNHVVKEFNQAEVLSQIGINTIAIRGYDNKTLQLAKQLQAAGFFLKRGDYFWPGAATGNGGTAYHEWTKLDRKARARDIGGYYITNGSHFQISPAYRGKYYTEAINKEIEFCKKANISYFAFDMEDYIQKNGEKADFSLSMLELFEKYWVKNHPGKKYIDPKVFERTPEKYPEYHTAWVDFKCMVWADFFAEMKKRFAEGLQGVQSAPYPGIIFSEWSVNKPWTEEGRNHCMRDRRFFEVFNTLEVSIYTSVDRGVRQFEQTLELFAKNYPDLKMKFIITPSPYALNDNYYSSTAPDYPERFKYMLMESFAYGCKGIIVWKYSAADLNTLRQYSEAMNILAQVEDIVIDGSYRNLATNIPYVDVTDNFYGAKSTWKNQKRVFAKALKLRNKELITVSEYLTNDELDVTVAYAPGAKAILRDLESNEIVARMTAQDKSFKIKITPERRCRMLLAEPLQEKEKL